MPENSDDTRRIEVGLSFISGADTAAMQQFTEGLKVSKDFFSSFDVKDFFNTVTQAYAVVENMKLALDQRKTQALAMQGAGGLPQNQIANLPSPGSTWDYNAQLGNYTSTQPGVSTSMVVGALGGALAAQTPSITQQTAQDDQEALVLNSQNANQPSSQPALQRSGATNFINAISQKLPRMTHGHLSLGSLLPGMMGGAAAGMAADELPSTLGGSISNLGGAAIGSIGAGIVGSTLASGFNMIRSAQHAVTSPISTAMSLINPYTAQMTGAQLGYQRAGSFLGLPFTGLGGPAQAEGERQAINTLGLAFQPGINLAQAQQIQQASAQYGFSGQMGSNVTDQLLGPLFQKFGMNPQQVLANFGGGLRSGVETVTQLRDALQGLGTAAQTASMSLTDTSNAVAQASQSVQSIGGTPQTGQQFGTSFQGLTGLPASVGGSLVTNPFIQSFIAMQTGVMPSLQGTLGSTNLTQGVLGGVNFLNSIYKNAFPTRTENISNPYGGGPLVTETQTPQSQAYALEANMLGLDVGQVKRMVQYQKATQWGGYLQGLSNQYIGNANERASTVPYSSLSHYLQSALDKPGSGTPGAKITGIADGKVEFTVGGTQMVPVPVESLTGGHDINWLRDKLAGQELSNKGIGGLSESTLDQQIKESQLWTTKGSGVGSTANEINRINKLYTSNPQNALKQINKDVSNQLKNAYQGTGSGGPTISIAMVGQAAKMFKASPNKINLNLNANSGTGPTMNYAIAQPQGASPLMGYTPYDSSS